MLKLIIKGFLLLIAIWASALVITRFDNMDVIEDQNALRIKAAGSFKDLDILFVGSSYVYSGVIPAAFDSANIRSFNLGIATTGAYYTNLVIEDFLKAYTTKTICIGMAYNTFSEIASDIWHLYPIHRYLETPESNESIVVKYGAFSDYFQMFRRSFKKGVKNVFIENGSIDSSIYRDVLANKGYELILDTVTKNVLNKEKHLFEPYLRSVFSEEKKECFFKTINDCMERGVAIVVFEPPTNNLHWYFSKEYIEEYNRFKKELKNKVKVIDCDTSDFDTSCFRNTDHLNNAGAKKFSAYLLKSIKEKS